MRLTALLAPSLAALALLSACSMPITEDSFLRGRATPLVSDRIQRSNVALDLPDVAGAKLQGWRLSPPSPRGQLIYFYGAGSSLWNMSRHLHELAQELELEVLAFDVRGTGASGGKSSFASLRADALRIHDQATRRGLPVLVMGYSMGSVSAIHLASQRPVQGLAVIAGISEFQTASRHFGAQIPWYGRPFVHLSFDPVFQQRPQPIDEIRQVRAPTFIFHGDADQSLPVEGGDALNSASPASWKRYQRPAGVGHGNLPLLEGEHKQVLRDWVQAGLQAGTP